MSEKFITVECRSSYGEFAAKVGVPMGTIKRWVHEGMPTERIGPRVYVVTPLAIDWVCEHRPTAGHRSGVVYFAEARGMVKIGFSSDTSRRMYEVDARLLATVPGSIALERAVHRLFADDRVDGEWFRPSQAIQAFIAALSAEAA